MKHVEMQFFISQLINDYMKSALHARFFMVIHLTNCIVRRKID